MKLSPTRFVAIEGTEVRASPTSNAEAQIALKELRQKKKEFALRRRALLAQAKKARATAQRAEGTATQRKKQGFGALIGRLFRKAKARTPKRELAEIEADIQATDEVLWNIDSCAVQIEGRLLHQS